MTRPSGFTVFCSPVPGAIFLFLAALFCLSCRGTPDPALPPAFSLSFDRAEASGSGLALYFVLKGENPRNISAVLGAAASGLSIDGTEIPGTLEFPLPAADGTKTSPRLGGGSTEEFPLAFKTGSFPIPLSGTAEQAETISAVLSLNLNAVFADGKKSSIPVKGRACLPRIREPSFTVSSITIIQAELINTRLKVRLRVENPNPFPVDLSSFAYELYGAGRFWAGGTEKKVFSVPAGARAEKELFLVMNFIDMRRELFDQVVAMEKVRYRFAGTVEVKTGVPWLPAFTRHFDMEGESEVTK